MDNRYPRTKTNSSISGQVLELENLNENVMQWFDHANSLLDQMDQILEQQVIRIANGESVSDAELVQINQDKLDVKFKMLAIALLVEIRNNTRVAAHQLSTGIYVSGDVNARIER